MVFNRKDLAKAFSPNKTKIHARRRLSGGAVHKPSTNGSTVNSMRNNPTGSQANVKVIVRVRPENERESQDNYRTIVKIIDDKMLIFDPKAEENPFFYHGVAQKGRDLLKKQNKEMEFIFDKVFDSNSSNLDVFHGSTKNIITTLLDGYNCSVFVYGATGAGKTHTMLGKDGDPGITYLTMSQLFSEIEVQSSQKNFTLGVSYLEVYNENVQDLLAKSGPLHIREDGRRGIMVAELKIMSISSADELLALLAKGNKNRTQHPTDANAESSRSHAVFQVYVNITNKLDGQVRHVKLSMIDLAGSERASATGCKGARFKEGANINKSLLALGNCINNLADGLSHIPYRDSKLTRLLKDSLGGNCQTVMIANISPSSLSYEDTYNTLRYANRAKKIKTNIKKNIVSCQMHVTGYIKMVEEQKKEINMLKQKLSAFESGTASPSLKVNKEDLSEWEQRISELYEKKKLLISKILYLESTDKILCCRIEYKKKANGRLQALTLDADALILEDVNSSGKTRVNKSMCFFKRQRESIKIQMNASWNELRDIEKEIQSLNLEIKLKGLATKLADKVTICKEDIEKTTLEQQLEHSKKICNLQETEISSVGNIVELVGKTLVRFFNLMNGYGTITDPMREEFKQLIKTSEGVKGIKWSDVEPSNEEKQFYNFGSLSIQQITNPLEHDLPPSPTILTEDEEAANRSLMNVTFDTAPIKEDSPAIHDATIIVDGKADSSLESQIEDLSETEPQKNGIDTEKLNNTLTLVENKAKKRVLMDKNQVASKPTISKQAKKITPETKQKPLRHNGNSVGKENNTTSKSVMSAKSIAILNRIKTERNKNSPSVLSEPYTDLSDSSLKTVRGKERRGLVSTLHPYNRPNSKPK